MKRINEIRVLPPILPNLIPASSSSSIIPISVISFTNIAMILSYHFMGLDVGRARGKGVGWLSVGWQRPVNRTGLPQNEQTLSSLNAHFKILFTR